VTYFHERIAKKGHWCFMSKMWKTYIV